ncbi:MAG: hypothetical protein KH452_08950 [Clostridiales bacterium]|nr:hypothetical protein [Clostridiales bacterium]
MGKIIRKLYIRFRVRLRILRLRLMTMQKPGDAKTTEKMLDEIKKASESA